MPEHMLFHVVFLGQVVLVSFVLPRKILARMAFVFETYPPETHPKLYPRPMEHYGSARQRNVKADGPGQREDQTRAMPNHRIDPTK